jgi:hypothetical protein
LFTEKKRALFAGSTSLSASLSLFFFLRNHLFMILLGGGRFH